MPHITIIGGGITGMAAAYHLQKVSRERDLGLTYSLIEAADSLGGKIVTDRGDSLVIEGGPDSFVTQKPEGAKLCRELGLGDRLVRLNAKPVYVLHKGSLHTIPAGFYLAVPANFVNFAKSRLFSLKGKLRMAMEPFISPRRQDADESLADFIRRRVGPEVLERIAGPIMAGIFVADPEHLSMQAAFPNFIDMEKKHGSLIKAIRALRKQRLAAAGGKKGGPPPSPFLTLEGGLVELVDALTAKLDGDLRPGTTVTSLAPREKGGWDVGLSDGTSLESDAIVLAIPSYRAADLVQPFAGDLAEHMRRIRYLSTATVSLAFRRQDLADAHHIDGLGFIVSDKQACRVMACTINSNKFNHRAPDDMLLLRFFIGGYAQEALAELPDEPLLAAVREELRDILHITAEPAVTRIFRWPKGNPQYDVGHVDRVREMERLAAAHKGLYLSGSAYHGIGIPGCIAAANRTVDQFVQNL